MLSKLLFAALYIGTTLVSAGVQSSKPGCVDKCWENTQYVSSCAGDNQCLCDDADFQNTVYQCLYTQCHTAQFGAALHHTLAMCSSHDAPAAAADANRTHHTAPALIRQDNRKMKRQYPMMSASVSASVMPTMSVGRMSVSASAYRGSPTGRAYGSPTGSPGARPYGSPVNMPYGSPTAAAYGKRR